MSTTFNITLVEAFNRVAFMIAMVKKFLSLNKNEVKLFSVESVNRR